MIFRIFFFALLIAFFYLFYKAFIGGKKQCLECEGLGYWKNTRGERNRCKECGGKGYE